MLQTCLIAAYDPWFIQLLRMYTEESGLRAVQVHEGQDVIPMIHQVNPVVVLLQMDLPGQIKGWEVLKAMKVEPDMCRIPILVFSWQGQGIPDDLIEGASTHLQGPVTYEAFQDALKKAGVCCEAGK